MQRRYFGAGLILALSFMPLAASAHVVVKPGSVNVAAYQTFNVGVPNEKDQPTTGLRLVIPAGLKAVTPNVKPGWTVATKQTGSGEGAVVTEIDWTGGQVPAGQRDDFAFSAQAPAKAGEVHWKAYQTYADGTEVAWDQTPKGADDESVMPYSTTKVIDDISNAATTSSDATDQANRVKLALALSVAALVLAVVALVRKAKI